jgi:hypothetical protein
MQNLALICETNILRQDREFLENIQMDESEPRTHQDQIFNILGLEQARDFWKDKQK